MKISQLYSLDKSQYELDFVDIDPEKDTPLFLDPYYISKCDFPFAVEAHRTIRSYFEYLLALLRGKKFRQAEELFSHLGESNDICMGMSLGKPRGHGMGPEDTNAIFKQLLQSRAIVSGIMEDIEDFRIFVPNVDKDKVSDMTANIIKMQLIRYTQEQCELHCIPLIQSVPSGMFWNLEKKVWDNVYTERLVIDERPILLVPKRIVSEICKFLIQTLESIPPGAASASKFHNLIIGILELLLYPNLSTPKKEREIHEGRKRIDIVFNNSAESGFFFDLPNKNVLLPCPFVYVECKNYTGEVENPELDQLGGRFSNRRGKVGILACRTLDNNELFMKRCADTFEDDRGLVIPITDEDLKRALTDFPKRGVNALEQILQEKYEQIVFMK